jgi:hypothetical protein
MKYVVIELAEDQVLSAHIEDNEIDALDYATDIVYKAVLSFMGSNESEEDMVAAIIPSGNKEDAKSYSLREAIYSILSEDNAYIVGAYSVEIITAT